MYLFSSYAVIKPMLAKRVLALCSSCVLGLSGFLAGCDSHKSMTQTQTETVYQEDHAVIASAQVDVVDIPAKNIHEKFEQQSGIDEEVGHKLTEIAGQASLPTEKYQQRQDKDDVLSKNELKYVGLYRTKIPCEDAFAQCDKGQAEYILNLLVDGTAHRTMVNLGRVYNDKAIKDRQLYGQDTWSYDAQNHEIVIHFFDGQNFYYRVLDPHHLIIHLDKNQQEQYDPNFNVDQKYYQQPAKAYVLKKVQDSVK